MDKSARRVKGLGEVSVRVKDLEAMYKFYEEVMGLEVLRRDESFAAPPGNRLVKLKGDRAGQHSIRINDQWRICLIWSDNKAKNVEILDYHG